MQDHGANFFCLEKLGRVKGVSNPRSWRASAARRSTSSCRRAACPERDDMSGTVGAQDPPRRRPDDRQLERLGVATVHEAQGRTA
jgi:hypothetical protein